jgi:hypothetical protein
MLSRNQEQFPKEKRKGYIYLASLRVKSSIELVAEQDNLDDRQPDYGGIILGGLTAWLCNHPAELHLQRGACPGSTSLGS